MRFHAAITCWPGTISPGRVDATPWSALDFFPTLSALAGLPAPRGIFLDGVDQSALLRDGNPSSEKRMLYHYFGVQLQAVREGPWKLLLPVTAPPEVRVPSLWFAQQPGLFERQHRLWPQPTLYDLANDPGEKNDVAAAHPERVAGMSEKARTFDEGFQKEMPSVRYLPGPTPPAPAQIRTPDDRLEAWLELLP
jgi:arylsulfatase A